MLKPLKTLVYFTAIPLTMAAGAWGVASAPPEVEPWSLESFELSESWDAAAGEPLIFPGSVATSADWRPALIDPQVVAAQASQTTPGGTSSRFTRPSGGRSPFSTTSLRTGAVSSSAFAGLASVPFMIGDTGAGTCLSFNTIGYIEGNLSHPSLTCSRLNVAENNRAITSDRIYYSYRHFENPTPLSLYQFSTNMNVDRHTLGIEKLVGDGASSFELRVPLEYRLNSNPINRAYDLNPPDTIIDPETAIFFGDRDLELANISAIFKTMLVAQNGFVMSAGLGVTAPTAQDVRYTVDLQNVFITYATLDPPLGVLSNYDVETHFTNETWYLSPFLAWACRNDSRFFHQGFLQFEMAANPSRVRLTDNGSFGVVTYDPFNPNPAPDFGVIWTIDGQVGGSTLVDLNAQPIMRLNLGGGYYLIDESDNHNFFDELVALFELHYTTTIQDSKPSPIPLGFIQVDLGGNLSQNIDAFDPSVGNLNSRIDILNAVMGVSATVHGTVVTNGFTVPLRTGDNRGFDFEYNLQIQRPF